MPVVSDVRNIVKTRTQFIPEGGPLTSARVDKSFAAATTRTVTVLQQV
jgi:hypothetical protein